MRTSIAGLMSLAVVAGAGAAATPAATAAPSDGPPAVGTPNAEPRPATPTDQLPNQLADKQNQLRQEAQARVLKGEARPRTVNGTTVLRVGREPAAPGGVAARGSRTARVQPQQPQYVQLEQERTDRVFVLLVQFGDQRDPDYPDQDTDPDTPGPTRFDGPGFNEIPEPGPADNSTQWRADYDQEYYENLYFGEGEGVESLKTYYETQSSGRYSVDGLVTEPVTVPYNQARYGRSNGEPCGGIVCSNTWDLIADGMDQWVADRKAAGATDAEIDDQIASFDKVDRYDFDGDGNFAEPDGYIDRLQVVHAGGDQADGDPYYGEDAIWSHRWYAFQGGIGTEGPARNPAGGTEVGDSDTWAADYTIQPENGGLSTIAHEYGHDLGLPDHYDTAAGGDNPVSWWTLMAQSRASAEGDRGIGTRPADLGVWDKLQLGWLDYETVVAGQKRTLVLGPHEFNTRRPQALAMVLPDKEVTSQLPTPVEGQAQWWSGGGDGYASSMAREVEVPDAGATLDLQVAYNIEEDYDYAFLEVEAPAGSGSWTPLPTGDLDADGDGAAEAGIDGVSDGYVPASYDLGDFAGSTIGFRVSYRTDGAYQGQDQDLDWTGIVVDDITVTSEGSTVLSAGAESPPNGWSLNGFSAVGATQTRMFDQFYLASYRAYVSYDRYLRTGPYHFGYPDQPQRVDHFPYQDGLLVNYWDTSYTDNNTSQHPGSGLVLPVDSHPQVHYNLQGEPWRGRVQNYDAPFSVQRPDSFTLHAGGRPSRVRGQGVRRTFDDTDPDRYYAPFARAGLPRVGVKTAGAGVSIRVLNQRERSMRIRIR